MEILTSVRRLYIRFKSLVNDFVYSFGRAALLLLVEVLNHTVPVPERRRIRVNIEAGAALPRTPPTYWLFQSYHSVSPGECRNSNVNWPMTASFYILSISAFCTILSLNAANFIKL